MHISTRDGAPHAGRVPAQGEEDSFGFVALFKRGSCLCAGHLRSLPAELALRGPEMQVHTARQTPGQARERLGPCAHAGLARGSFRGREIRIRGDHRITPLGGQVQLRHQHSGAPNGVSPPVALGPVGCHLPSIVEPGSQTWFVS